MHSVCFHRLKADALQSWASQKIFICMPHCHWTLIWSVGSQRCDQLLSVTSRGVNWHLVLPSQERRVNRKAGSLNRIQAQNRLAPCWQSQWEGEAGGNLFGLISLIFYLVLSFSSASIFTTALFNAGIDACCLLVFFIVFWRNYLFSHTLSKLHRFLKAIAQADLKPLCVNVTAKSKHFSCLIMQRW